MGERIRSESPYGTRPKTRGRRVETDTSGDCPRASINQFGKPPPHVKVRAAAVDKRDNRYYLPATTTDETGRYELRFVAPGEQCIQTEPFWLFAADAPKESSHIITVKSGTVVENVNFSTAMANGGEPGGAVGQHVGPGFTSSWSPDGTKLVVAKVLRGPGSDAGLEILDLVSGKSRDLVQPGKDPAWSPAADGFIAFLRGSNTLNEEVWIVRPDGTGTRRIGGGSWPQWSGDGKTLYFHDNAAHQIMAVQAADMMLRHARSVPSRSPTGRPFRPTAAKSRTSIDKVSSWRRSLAASLSRSFHYREP